MDYLKGLHGIRAIAALSVLYAHVVFVIGQTTDIQYAHAAVIIFFALSGFLITYLLLNERQENGKIDIKDFYKRRIMRIWPLYFLYIAINLLTHIFVLKDGIKNANNLAYYFVFLQNYPMCYLKKPVIDMGHLWSIAAEEQFYLLWPIIFYYSKNINKTTILLIIVWVIGKGLLKIYADHINNVDLFYFVSSSSFDYIAIGALGACLFRERNKVLYKILPIAPYLFIPFVLLQTFYRFNFFSILTDNVIAGISTLFFVYIINRNGSILEAKPLKYLGKISFGIYIYHGLIMSLVFFAYRCIGIPTIPIYCLLGIAGATIIVASLSYKYIEQPFLRLKHISPKLKYGTVID